jgi:hypothetical protein
MMAMKADMLGPAVPQLAELSPLDKEVEEARQRVNEQLCRPLTKAETKDVRMRCAVRAFEAEYHRAPADGAELGRFLAKRTGPQRRAVTGYDLTFSSEELSLLFALAPRSGGSSSRPWPGSFGGPGVAGAPCARGMHRPAAWAQQRAEPGLVATVYLHYESRAGDPVLHEHAVIPRGCEAGRTVAQPGLEAPSA